MKSNLWEKQESMEIPGVHDVNRSMDGIDKKTLEGNINFMANSCKENFMVYVSARFKPKEDVDDSNEKKIETDASLPLHQRLALIKLSNNITSNKKAIGILKERGEWFKEKWAAEECKDSENNDNANEDSNALWCGVHSIDEKKARVVTVDQTKGLSEFNFDNVFNGLCPQNIVYESSARRLVADFINGYNATFFVYGKFIHLHIKHTR